MSSRIVIVPIIAAHMLLAACAPAAPSPEGGEGPDAPVSAWQARGLRDYAFDFERQCFCVPEAVQPVRIEVRGGEITEVRSRDTGEVVPLSPAIPWYTVDELLRQADVAQADGQEVRVEYHADGFPSQIEIGSLAADAGVIYNISNLSRLR
jgi:hypothetical protein